MVQAQTHLRKLTHFWGLPQPSTRVTMAQMKWFTWKGKKKKKKRHHWQPYCGQTPLCGSWMDYMDTCMIS